ncbi:MAG: NIPSNAP family protein [Bryobacteraceae bacterium]|nr:NIPSNAP family protein [Bryobacteraceae bacterium]
MLKKLLLASLLMTTMTFAADTRIYELRTYRTLDGRLDALMTRFRDHTLRLFEKHGMENLGYWVPEDQPNTLIYLLGHKSKEAGMKSWADFQKDTDWVKARTASEVSGKIVEKVDRVWLSPTDFSKMK